MGSLPERELRRLRGGGIGFVFQEPGAALDPVRTIGSELIAVLCRHRGLTRAEARREALSWLSRVALPDPDARMDDLPHRMSGGMRQRAMVALALAGGPRLLVADEPTTALDVTIQAQILELLLRLRDELGLAVLLVTHDLGIVAEVADRALVMYAGEIVEEAPVEQLSPRPNTPTRRRSSCRSPAQRKRRGGRSSRRSAVLCPSRAAAPGLPLRTALPGRLRPMRRRSPRHRRPSGQAGRLLPRGENRP